ncbi:hypothetical protein ACQ4N7_25600 [Nodosilinea sp. AN01ver1]|uniref:hypothetical protein n=1 Tax=Nodosilinea sp. AN01ver1 TaxID=3423362 RepID=UPI003D313AD7
MLNLNSQSNQNSAIQNPDSSLPFEFAEAIGHIVSEAQLTQSQVEMLQKCLTSRSLKSSRRTSYSPQLGKSIQDDYSPIIKLAFRVLKFFSLFLLGSGIAFVVSASLQATGVTNILVGLLSYAFIPIAGMTFCIVAISIILESFK